MKNLIELWHNIGLKRGTSWPSNGRAEIKWHTRCLRSSLMMDIKILEVIRFIGTLTPKNDQDRISPYNIDTITRQVMKMKQNFNLGNIS